VWQLTPGWAAPILTQWGQMRPMAIKKLSDFDVGPPPSPTSEQFAKDYAEVKAVGARNSTTRTADQTAAAIFWTTQVMVPWNMAAQAASRARKLTIAENARLFALLNMAAFDSGIVTVEQKYRYNHWRPYNAIRAPAVPANPALASDASWEPLLVTPGHPDYPSATASRRALRRRCCATSSRTTAWSSLSLTPCCSA